MAIIKRDVFVVFIAVLASASSAGLAEDTTELTVFTAASLTGAFSEIGQLYTNETNVRVAFNFDGSQNLRTQIENGAYADVFASANMRQMDALKKLQLIDNGSIIIFTENKLSLIVPKGNAAKISGLADLARPGLKIIMGTKDVPVGDYALRIINSLGNDSAYGPDYRAKVMANIISQETTVNYVVTKVALGEADVGFAYISDVTEDLASRVDQVAIPDEYNVIAKYPIGVVRESRFPSMSQEFIDFVTSEPATAILERYGFSALHSSEIMPKGNDQAGKATA